MALSTYVIIAIVVVGAIVLANGMFADILLTRKKHRKAPKKLVWSRRTDSNPRGTVATEKDHPAPAPTAKQTSPLAQPQPSSTVSHLQSTIASHPQSASEVSSSVVRLAGSEGRSMARSMAEA